MEARSFLAPWSVEEQPAWFVVRDNAGQEARLRLFRGRARAAMRQKNVIKKHFRKLMHSP